METETPEHKHEVLVVMFGERWRATCKGDLETWTSEHAEVPAEVLEQVRQARELASGAL